MRARPVLLAAALALASAGAGAQNLVYLALGDSITDGVGDPMTGGGYPVRLQKILRDAGESVDVRNYGIPGETTSEALSRINGVLGFGGDCLLLMEGTNDITLVARGVLSLETVIANLNSMADNADSRGIRPVLATVIPRFPGARFDPNNFHNGIFAWELREQAFLRGRALVDNFELFNPEVDPAVFSNLYASIPNDGVGHPNPAGYDKMAAAFADVLLDRDTMVPVPGRFSPASTSVPIPVTTQIRATLYEPAGSSGIDLEETFLVINGNPVAEPTAESSRRKAELVHQGRRALGCRAKVSIRSQDRADPPNTIERVLAVYDLEDRKVFPGDIDFDCRVDGVDLVAFALAFGSEKGDARFDPDLDFNADGRIDGEDLAVLASNFGKDSS